MSQGAIVNPNRAIPRFRLNNVTPFTYRDGLTYLQILEELRDYLNANLDYLVENGEALQDFAEEAINHLQGLAENSEQAATDVQNIFDELQANGPVVSINGRHGIVKMGAVDVKDHGAIGDGITDDTEAINTAIQVALDEKRPLLFSQAPDGYLVTSTLNLNGLAHVRMESPVYWGGTLETAIVVGDPDTVTWYGNYQIWVEWDKLRRVSTWADERDVGVEFHNLNTCKVSIVNIKGFTIGARLVASNAGFVFNDFYLGRFLSNRRGLVLVGVRTSGTGMGGWVNENNFYNGTWSVDSSLYPDLSRTCVIITSTHGRYHNNNVFYKPSFEIGHSVEPGVDATPVIIEYGVANTFRDVRTEQSPPHNAHIRNDSRLNRFDIGYQGTHGLSINDESSHVSTTVTGTQLDKRLNSSRLVYGINNIPSRISTYRDDNRNYVHGASILNAGDLSSVNSHIGITQNYDGNFATWPNLYVGFYVTTDTVKSFYFERDVLDGATGRATFIAYDESGNVIDDSSAIRGNGLVRLATGARQQGADISWSSILVSDDVKRIFVGVSGNTSLKIRSMNLYTDTQYTPTCSNDFPGAALNLIAIVEPSESSTVRYERGTIIYNVSATVNPGVAGWRCVESGTPGTWLEL